MKTNLTVTDWTLIVVALGVTTFLSSLARPAVVASAAEPMQGLAEQRMMIVNTGDRVVIRTDDGVVLVSPLAKPGDQITPAFSFTPYTEIKKGK